MAKVASSGAEEALVAIESQPRKSVRKAEAFVMSGDRIISMNRNISSALAKIHGDQLHPNTEICSNSSTPLGFTRGTVSAGVAFPSMHRTSSSSIPKKQSRLPVSVSQPDGVRRRRQSESPAAPIEKPESSISDDEEEKFVFDDNHIGQIENEKENENENEKMKGAGDKLSQIEPEYMQSPNEEIVNKSLQNAIFAQPKGTSPSPSTSSRCAVATVAPFSSSPQIHSKDTSGDVGDGPLYDNVDEEKNNSTMTKTKFAEAEFKRNDSFSKRSVVTLDATSTSNRDIDNRNDCNTTFFTTCETPIRTSSPLRKQIFKNTSQFSASSSSASASPSLHANSEKRAGGSINCTLATLATQASTSNHTMNSTQDHREQPAIIARKLYELKDCTAKDVADRLNEQSDSAFQLLVSYLDLFQFSTIRIDAALRDFLSRVELRGESSQRERLLRVFSARYLECNPSIFESLDDVHTLTCALLLLNSDLHGPNTGKKMTARDFITNIGHTGCVYKRDVLKTLYQSIKDQPIALQQAPTSKKSVSKSISKQYIYEVDPNSVVEYYSGYLMRKHVRDSDGVKTPFGRRSWKMVYARLRGLVLYFDKDEVPKATSRYSSLENAVSLHHALAEPAIDYKKKQFVFHIRIAHGGEILLQTSSENEVKEWCKQINFVAAAFSSPTLPLPVTAKPESAPMPRLPKVPCLAPIATQIRIHESRVAELAAMIEAVSQGVYPEKPQQQITDRLMLLLFEKRRYQKYAQTLREKYDDRKMSSATINTVSVSPKKSASKFNGSLKNCEDRLSYTDAVNGYN
ncbi:unnamed protein product [Caenorhabditis angaria]|uniref:Uncharacterized protein n=1 Tax=Caenorhabditis angaria TaxID=860376 RepID=A0A9P1N231_9PELO|nr:unnamed protein product [Caenorhabditis angaria]